MNFREGKEDEENTGAAIEGQEEGKDDMIGGEQEAEPESVTSPFKKERIPRKKENMIEVTNLMDDVTIADILEIYNIRLEPRNQTIMPEMKENEEESAKNDSTPSMWDYDPRRLPKEFVDLDQGTFLADPHKLNLCFLNKDILARICAKVRHFYRLKSFSVVSI